MSWPSVHVLCGDAFYDALIDHPNVRATYQNWAAAAELRQNMEFEAFPYGGIVFHNCQGTDDFDDAGTEGAEMFGIPSTRAKFFPVGAPGVFEAAWSPGESFDFANTPGLPMYGIIVRDHAIERRECTRLVEQGGRRQDLQRGYLTIQAMFNCGCSVVSQGSCLSPLLGFETANLQIREERRHCDQWHHADPNELLQKAA